MADIFLRVYVLLSVLLTTYGTMQCQNNQNLYTSKGKKLCCNYCDAGEQMVARCTESTQTKCKKCEDKEYNPQYTNVKCRDCTECDTSKGSIVVKPCDRSSDAVCRCPLGSTPINDRKTACICDKGKQIVGQECVACPLGYFSSQENSICRPWTNCSAKGKELQRVGTSTSDSKCIQRQSVPTQIPLIISTTKSSTTLMVTVSQRNTTLRNLYTTNKSTVLGNSVNGALPLIIIGVILLSFSAGLIFMMVIQMNKKKKNKRFQSHRCRTPVQEVSSSSDRSIDKQYQALDTV